MCFSSGVVHAKKNCAVNSSFRRDAKGKVMTGFIYLSRTDLDVEVASLIGDFEDFGPGETIDPQTVSVDEQTVGAHTQHNVNSF